jgi:aspartate kinase
LRLNVDRNKRLLDRFVVKFGGTSLADGLGISRAADSVVKKAKKGGQIAVVVSAMGKTTDHLIDTANQACEAGGRRKVLMDPNCRRSK